jgi:YHS domain-containing protein
MRILITIFLMAGTAWCALAQAAPAVEARTQVRCPVTGMPVASRALFHYVTVQGRRYYVLDREAAIRLKQAPDCYVRLDGKPVNAK